MLQKWRDFATMNNLSQLLVVGVTAVFAPIIAFVAYNIIMIFAGQYFANIDPYSFEKNPGPSFLGGYYYMIVMAIFGASLLGSSLFVSIILKILNIPRAFVIGFFSGLELVPVITALLLGTWIIYITSAWAWIGVIIVAFVAVHLVMTLIFNILNLDTWSKIVLALILVFITFQQIFR